MSSQHSFILETFIKIADGQKHAIISISDITTELVKIDNHLRQLEQEMLSAAESLDFERASQMRDLLPLQRKLGKARHDGTIPVTYRLRSDTPELYTPGRGLLPALISVNFSKEIYVRGHLENLVNRGMITRREFPNTYSRSPVNVKFRWSETRSRYELVERDSKSSNLYVIAVFNRHAEGYNISPLGETFFRAKPVSLDVAEYALKFLNKSFGENDGLLDNPSRL